MKAFLDFEEKSVKEAVKKACSQLNISQDHLKYDVISHGSSGIFGLVGAKKALIRVFLPKSARAEKPTPSPVEAAGADEPAEGPERSQRETVNALVDEAFGKPEPEEEPVPVPEADQTNEKALSVARELVEKILAGLPVDAEISDEKTGDPGTINIKGADAGILIGKRGQTLEAIQYLVDKVVNKQCGKGNRIIVDVEGYVESRKSELKELASSLAKKALKTGKPSTMNRMNAHDRRVVHVALKNNRSVRTQSVGGGYYRKLIIFPKKKGQPKQTQKE